MTLINIAALTTTVVYLMLGGILYAHSRRKTSEKFFGLMSLSLTVWGLATFLVVAISQSVTLLQIGAYTHYIAGNLVFLCLLWFSIYFPERTARSLILPFTLTIIDGIFFIVILFSNFLFTSFFIGLDGQKHIGFNDFGYIVYTLYILFLYITAEIILFKKYKKWADAHKAPLFYIFLGTVAASTPALVSNLILPYFGQFTLFAAGPIFGILFIIFIGYAVFKHNLLNVKIIATEFFVALIILVILIDVLSANSFAERSIKMLTLASVSVLSYLIIRSVLQEVKTRLQIEQLAGELKETNKELERVSQAKSDFLSIVSHQLKTPLSIIKGYVSMSMEGAFGKMSKELRLQMNKVYISNERLISLVEDLLNLSRIEDGRMKYDWDTADIGEIAYSVAEEMRDTAKKKNLAFVFKKPTEVFRARVDINKIRNVIFNLIDNAIKYTNEGSITISLGRNNNHIILSVSDTGRGMKKENLAKIFQKFTRAEHAPGSRNARVYGFGLGLYVARLITDAHHGTIRAESQGMGAGSTFILELPIISSEPAPKSATAEHV